MYSVSALPGDITMVYRSFILSSMPDEEIKIGVALIGDDTGAAGRSEAGRTGP